MTSTSMPNKAGGGQGPENLKGGSAIASGGYGCVFKPNLACSNEPVNANTTEPMNGTMRSNTKYVSKLMFKKHATKEYNESQMFLDIIKRIENHNDYFIFPEAQCNPKHLSDADKVDFNRKCISFIPKNINNQTVNDEINKLSVLQLPDGGIDLQDYIESKEIYKSEFYVINKILQNLLTHAIVPMNQANLYHMDLKASNVLYDNTEKKIRLIDWGLSARLNDNGDLFNRIGGRPLHYNLPYSILLLNDDFLDYIENILYKHHNSYTLTVDFTYEAIERYYLNHLSKQIGDGHLKYIDYICKKISHGYHPKHHDVFMYIAKIIVHYRTPRHTFDVRYFDVFRHNVDLWGFVTLYMPFMDIDDKMVGNETKQVKQNVRKLYTDFLHHYVTERIPIEKLLSYLSGLNRTYYYIRDITPIGINDRKVLKTISYPPVNHSSYKSKWGSKISKSITKKKRTLSKPKSKSKSTSHSKLSASEQTTGMNLYKTPIQTRKRKTKSPPKVNRRTRAEELVTVTLS